MVSMVLAIGIATFLLGSLFPMTIPVFAVPVTEQRWVSLEPLTDPSGSEPLVEPMEKVHGCRFLQPGQYLLYIEALGPDEYASVNLMAYVLPDGETDITLKTVEEDGGLILRLEAVSALKEQPLDAKEAATYCFVVENLSSTDEVHVSLFLEGNITVSYIDIVYVALWSLGLLVVSIALMLEAIVLLAGPFWE